MTETEDQVGARIARFRRERGLSASALAINAKISKSYLSTLESATTPRRPSGEVLLRIAEALGVEIPDLLGATTTEHARPVPPPSLREFARIRRLPEADVVMLAGINFRGRQPQTVESWGFVYNAIRASTALD